MCTLPSRETALGLYARAFHNFVFYYSSKLALVMVHEVSEITGFAETFTHGLHSVQ